MSNAGKGLISLVSIAVVAAGLLATIEQVTAQRIEQNREHALWSEIRTLLSTAEEYERARTRGWQDNELALCDGRWLVRLHQSGYGGDIQTIALLDSAKGLQKLRVTHHFETPGIGDFIEDPDHPWMQALVQARRANPLDAITGATITSRALVEVAMGLQDWTPRSTCSEPEA